jgi:hypothetical protein
LKTQSIARWASSLGISAMGLKRAFLVAATPALTFSTVGDSRQDPNTFDKPSDGNTLNGQDAVWLQTTELAAAKACGAKQPFAFGHKPAFCGHKHIHKRGVPTPLLQTAFSTGGSYHVTGAPLDFALQVQGVSAVPEPAAWALWMASAQGIAGAARRRVADPRFKAGEP